MGWEITYENGERKFISLNEGFEIIGELIGELLFDAIKGRYSDMEGLKLLNLKGERLEVWKVDDGTICVKYINCEVKDGPMLKGVFGMGTTFEEACDNYYKQISGKTLVFKYGESAQKEVTVL